jgi:hypothetical protein
MRNSRFIGKSVFKRFLLIVVALWGIIILCEGHQQRVHQAITQSAVLSSAGFGGFLGDAKIDPGGLLLFHPAEFNPDPPTLTPIGWVTNGAYYEDAYWFFADHFYTVHPSRTVGQAPGLTDRSESVALPFNVTNSFAWATSNLPSPYIVGWGSPTPTNAATWGCARGYELAALTNSLCANRNSNAAHLFYALGMILHLNQDLSQPDHVRNDEHDIPWHKWIENFGKDVYLNETNAFPLETNGWSYFQGQGFTKLLDFWDRGLFTNGTSTGLDNDANGVSGATLGLAEYCNGNFLGEDATYAEFFKTNSGHYFPFPSLTNTTQPQLNPHDIPGSVVDTITLRNHKAGSRVFLTKTNAGVVVVHHSALHYFAVRNSSKIDSPGMSVAFTINDPDVLQEYHTDLIPKAIEYSAGILDYFFRGNIDAIVKGGTNGVYDVGIVNASSQDFNGGGFQLYYDDASSNRTPVAESFSTAYSTTLASGSGVEASLTLDTNAVTYFLIYQGTIGAASGSTCDPVDTNIAIAITNFTLPQLSFSPTNGSVGVAYTGAVTWTGISSPTLTTNGSLPPGLSIDLSDGEITGTPTNAGTFDFSVTATDGVTGYAYEQDFEITITNQINWNNLVWGSPTIAASGSGTASGAFANNHFSASTSASVPYVDYGIADCTGSMTYTGPAVTCVLHVSGSVDGTFPGSGQFTIIIEQDGSPIAIVSSTSGDTSFTVSAGVGSVLTVNAQNQTAPADGALTGSFFATDSGSITPAY